jgi:hypothetical protein
VAITGCCNSSLNSRDRGRSKNKKQWSKHFFKQQKRRRDNQLRAKASKEVAWEMSKMISHHFPDFYQRLREVVDPRHYGQYGIDEIIFGGISLFLFKCGSRNVLDNLMEEKRFRKNFNRLFGLRLPKMDTVAGVLKSLDENALEDLKVHLVKVLLSKRVFDKWRHQGALMVAIDGTGIASFDHRHCDRCLVKTSKNDKSVWFHNVLEAKLVTPNGFSISLATEWIENPGREYEKQDCEQKAFPRLAAKLKTMFPRLAICICADGLYPNNTFFTICRAYEWNYIVTLEDGNLKTFWQTIRPLNKESKERRVHEGSYDYIQQFQWLNQVDFKGFPYNWLQLNEQVVGRSAKSKSERKFAYLTNFPLTEENIGLISDHGRLRWKIENEGFDQQKNHGYNICHKYCRNSYRGMKNFYQCCQIAHMINQLVELTRDFQERLTKKKTHMHLWIELVAFMIYGHVSTLAVKAMHNHKYQVQYIE